MAVIHLGRHEVRNDATRYGVIKMAISQAREMIKPPNKRAMVSGFGPPLKHRKRVSPRHRDVYSLRGQRYQQE